MAILDMYAMSSASYKYKLKPIMNIEYNFFKFNIGFKTAAVLQLCSYHQRHCALNLFDMHQMHSLAYSLGS